MYVVLISLGINLFCVLLAAGVSMLSIRSTLVDGIRVQPDKRVSMDTFWKRLPLVLFNLLVLQVFAGFGVYTAVQAGWIDQEGLHLGWMFLQFLLFLFFDDLYFYGFHRLMHENEFLYRKIHRIHHRATTPFALEFIYVHPLEWMGGTIGIAIGFLSCVLLFGSVNMYAFWFYVFYRSAHEIEIHSGFETGLLRWLPFYGSVKHHDDHHAKIKGNYASSLTYLDRLFKTKV